MTIKVYSDTLSGACGISHLSEFSDDDDDSPSWSSGDTLKDAEFGGAGWGIMAFINDRLSKKAYREAKRLYKVVYQSPLRRNANSGNEFFFIVLDGSEKKKPRARNIGKWPTFTDAVLADFDF